MAPTVTTPDSTAPSWSTGAYAAGALTAFAANSLLCRAALVARSIDPATFTMVRLASGALLLSLLTLLRGPGEAKERARSSPGGRDLSLLSRGSGAGAAYLFVYAAAFSFAYVRLGAGLGALILFGSVQGTMLLASSLAGERPRGRELVGVLVALAGLVVLTRPGDHAPDLLGLGLMVLSGIAWGLYTLRGRGSVDPAAVTTGNFVRSVPLGLAAWLPFFFTWHLSLRGLLLASISGAVTSGLGYVLWYAAVRHLTATRAAALQLLVPVLAAVSGVLLLDEIWTPRLAAAASLVLLGVGLVAVRGPKRPVAGSVERP